MKRNLATILLVITIIFSVLLILVVATYLAITEGDVSQASTGAKMTAYGATFVAVALIVLTVWASRQLRVRAIAKRRPGALVIHGSAPALTLKHADAPPEELKQAEESSSQGASLVVTDEAFEIWSNDDLVDPIRSIPNTPNVQIWREDRFFNLVSTPDDTRYIYHEATVIRGPSGVEIVFRSDDEPASFNSIVGARAEV